LQFRQQFRRQNRHPWIQCFQRGSESQSTSASTIPTSSVCTYFLKAFRCTPILFSAMMAWTIFWGKGRGGCFECMHCILCIYLPLASIHKRLESLLGQVQRGRLRRRHPLRKLTIHTAPHAWNLAKQGTHLQPRVIEAFAGAQSLSEQTHN
jgi:hypothetical protein